VNARAAELLAEARIPPAGCATQHTSHATSCHRSGIKEAPLAVMRLQAFMLGDAMSGTAQETGFSIPVVRVLLFSSYRLTASRRRLCRAEKSPSACR
jgi:hypothetical protein